jgi:indole-3-glycerol phosphate synthase
MILSEIVENKKLEVEKQKESVSEELLWERVRNRTRFADFQKTISRGEGRLSLICEIKKASPSAGVIRDDFDPVEIARAYESGGADALSVLTEEKYFQGRLEYIAAIREAGVSLPILRKDFTCDLYQVVESAAHGADAVLLLVGVMSRADTEKGIRLCEECGMAAVVEVHTAEQLREAIAIGAKIIQINNRDLRSFRVDLSVTERLVPLVPPGRVVISASGIKSPEQISRLRQLKVDAVLIGESLMRQGEPAAFLQELAAASR